MSEQMFLTLLQHLRWADGEVLGSLRAARPHAAALELFAHILGAEETWLARLENRAPRLAVWPEIGLDEAAELADSVHASLAAWLARADAAAFAEEIVYRNSAGRQFTTRAVDIMLHVMLHGAYHRGQIALLVRQGGGIPAPTDYIAFVRGAAAATRTADS